MDPESFEKGEKPRVVMSSVEIVQNHKELLARKTCAELVESIEQVRQPFPLPEQGV
jgi:hypothetical protein